nr:MAG TPA: Protein of unknown function (DUF3119) [Caudoviricetes sp.]
MITLFPDICNRKQLEKQLHEVYSMPQTEESD